MVGSIQSEDTTVSCYCGLPGGNVRRETAILMLPVLAAGLALASTRVRNVAALTVTRADGQTDVVRTSHVLAIITNHANIVVNHGHHLPMTTLWVSSVPEPIQVMQRFDQFKEVVSHFAELHTNDGPVLINSDRVGSIRPSGLLQGKTVDTMHSTTRITFEGGRVLVVSETPEYTAAMLGRAA